MGKTIKRIKTVAFIIILLEIIFGAAFSILYFNNFFEFQTKVTPFYIALVSIAILVINCLFVWIVILLLSSLRQKTDLRAAEVIGGDIQEAYNFAMIGLAITDDKNVVLWTNDLFKARHIEIMDMDIIAWQPELTALREVNNGEQSVKVVVNSRTYAVKLLPEAGLWIFKDITDYEQIFNYSKEQAPVVGILAIDNYDDVVRGDDDFNDVVTKVKNDIFGYAKDYGILLRRLKDDSYSMLCNYASFTRMLEDKFSIIDKVRGESTRGEIPLTLSIGIAHDFPDVNKLNDLANDALDIAMSRGGDQVVVSAYGQEMKFYGGKSEAQEKRNRVKTRVLADSLISLINASERVLIMGHAMMDMDAFGACLGMKAICARLKKNSFVVVDLKNTEAKTRAALTSSFSKDELEKLIVSSKDAEDLINGNTLLVVVDVHIPNMVMAPKLVDKAAKIVVIDHHRRAEEYIDSPVFNHIDPAASSTCELISEFIRFSSINPRIELPSTYATIMLSGIFLDSAYFKSRNTGIRTFEAATILKEYGADNSLADDFLKDDYEEHKEVSEITSNLETPFYGVVIATANPDRLYDHATIAKAANMCLTYKGVHASFVFGKVSQREIRLSARSDGTINVSLLTEKLGGGGHFTSAAATFNGNDMKVVKQKILMVLESSLTEATNAGLPKNNEED
ncbi:MAG: DHH family phosphoesterase [Bacilli bacterium]|nr:DHH family phosphoesterase [Bacilli bacterium]